MGISTVIIIIIIIIASILERFINLYSKMLIRSAADVDRGVHRGRKSVNAELVSPLTIAEAAMDEDAQGALLRIRSVSLLDGK